MYSASILSICLKKIGADGYKVHTTDINNNQLLKRIAQTKKKVFCQPGAVKWKRLTMRWRCSKGAT